MCTMLVTRRDVRVLFRNGTVRSVSFSRIYKHFRKNIILYYYYYIIKIYLMHIVHNILTNIY